MSEADVVKLASRFAGAEVTVAIGGFAANQALHTAAGTFHSGAVPVVAWMSETDAVAVASRFAGAVVTVVQGLCAER